VRAGSFTGSSVSGPVACAGIPIWRADADGVGAVVSFYGRYGYGRRVGVYEHPACRAQSHGFLSSGLWWQVHVLFPSVWLSSFRNVSQLMTAIAPALPLCRKASIAVFRSSFACWVASSSQVATAKCLRYLHSTYRDGCMTSLDVWRDALPDKGVRTVPSERAVFRSCRFQALSTTLASV